MGLRMSFHLVIRRSGGGRDICFFCGPGGRYILRMCGEFPSTRRVGLIYRGIRDISRFQKLGYKYDMGLMRFTNSNYIGTYLLQRYLMQWFGFLSFGFSFC